MDMMVVKDQSSNRVFAVFRVDNGRVNARGVGAGIEWAKWATRRGLNMDQVIESLDPSLSISKQTATAELLELFNQEEEVSPAKVKAYQDWANKSALEAMGVKERRRGFGRGLARGLAEGLRNFADAVDGDSDGTVFDGTPMERPAPSSAVSEATGRGRGRLLDRVIDAVAQGAEAAEALANDPEKRRDIRDRAEAAMLRQLRAIGEEEGAAEAFGDRLAALAEPGGARAAARRARERVGEEVRRLREGMEEAVGLHGPLDGAAPNAPEPNRPDLPGLLRSIAWKNRRIGRRTKAGFALPHVVPVGHNGIKDQDGASKALTDGADIADIPDEFLAKAILDNVSRRSTRFRVISTNGSVNDPDVLEDTVSGHKLILKYARGTAYGGNEDLGEILGGHLAERVGFHAGTIRLAGKAAPPRREGRRGKSATPIVISLADENYGDGYEMPRAVANREGTMSALYEPVATQDLVSMTLLDMMMLNSDRHGGNFLLHDDEDGVRHYIPIDQGLAFNGRDTSGGAEGAMDGYMLFRHEATEDNFLAWLRGGRGGRLNKILAQIQTRATQDGGANRPEIIAAIEAVQQRMREAEEVVPFAEVLQQALGVVGVEDAKGALGTANARMEFIMNTPADQLLRLLTRA